MVHGHAHPLQRRVFSYAPVIGRQPRSPRQDPQSPQSSGNAGPTSATVEITQGA
jgi:hypothetical protein